MVNRPTERSRSIWSYGFRVPGVIVTGCLAVLFAVGGGSLTDPAIAAELMKDAPVGADHGLSDPAISKGGPLNDLGQDQGDPALFQKTPMVPYEPSLGRGATRCNWWLPPDLPLGGGFSFALFCNGQAFGVQLGDNLPDPDIGES